jgi:hypothetical protein
MNTESPQNKRTISQKTVLKKWIFLIFMSIVCIAPARSQTTNICGIVDCRLIGSLKYEDLCKKPADITETTRTKICGNSYTSCVGIGCKTICNCKVYNSANCCYSGKQCTSDFVKAVCGSIG